MRDISIPVHAHINKRLLVSGRSFFGWLVIASLMITIMLNELGFSYPGDSYLDEVITVVLSIYIFLNWEGINHYDQIIMFCLFGIIILGVISNVASGVDRRVSYILFDILLLSKTFVSYVGIKTIVRKQKTRETIISALSLFSEVFIFSAFVLGTVSLFYDIGMTKGERYGIKSYSFIFNQPAHCGLFVAICLAILLLNEKLSKKMKHVFSLMAIITMIYTTKGMAMVVAGTFILLEYFTSKNKKLKWYHFTAIVIATGCILTYQAQNYLMNTRAPRSRFIITGFKIANRFFPLGSGFATYGSEMARRYYSPVYVEYGFDNIPGLASWYDMYLNDNYMGMIIGQFGYFGLLLHLAELLIILLSILHSQTPNKQARNISLAIFFSLSCIFVASGTYKSMLGTCLFMVIGLFTGPQLNKAEKR